MRIIAGSHRGRTLIAPKDRTVRPTTDRIREALFSKLDAMGVIADARVLDLFAGTGALGFEALSRGAAHVTAVEQAPSSIRLITDNTKALGLENALTLLRKDATKPLSLPHPATLVFCDAPYGKGLTEPALMAQRPALENCVCVVELDKRESFEAPDGYACEDERVYGDTKLVFLQTITG